MAINSIIKKMLPIRGGVIIDLENGCKIALGQTYNYAYSPNSLLRSISLGDSLHKDADSDTVFVIKGERTLRFCLNNSLNLDLR